MVIPMGLWQKINSGKTNIKTDIYSKKNVHANSNYILNKSGIKCLNSGQAPRFSLSRLYFYMKIAFLIFWFLNNILDIFC